ncbi:MAG: hypothetical protein NVS2B12_21610 [Ktedonobacteraceae bacterium]
MANWVWVAGAAKSRSGVSARRASLLAREVKLTTLAQTLMAQQNKGLAPLWQPMCFLTFKGV